MALSRQRMTVRRLIRRYGVKATLRIVSEKAFDVQTGLNTESVSTFVIRKALKLSSVFSNRLFTDNVDFTFSKTTVILTKDELPQMFTTDMDHEFCFDDQKYHISEVDIFPDLAIAVFQLENVT